MMLTIFATPKPFRGHIGIIQRNAIRSWTLLHPEVEVILFGGEDGAAEVAHEFGIRHEAEVHRNESGTPFVDDIFDRAQELARHPVVCYVNSDIILMPEFCQALERVSQEQRTFLMIGRRWDINITELWNFAEAGWELRLRNVARQEGKQREPQWIDYFGFPRGMYHKKVLPFLLGRTSWDNWLVWEARTLGIPVVDVSAAVTAVHQNHDYLHHPGGEKAVWQGEEAKRNFSLAGEGKQYCTIEDATHQLSSSGTLRRTPLRKPVAVAKRFLWDIFVHRTFPLRKRLGMRRNGWLKAFKRDSASRA